MAQVPPQYNGGGAIGWFDRYAEFDPTFRTDIVDVDTALEGMVADGLEPSLAGKRLLALAAIACVDLGEEGRQAQLAAALSVLMPEDAELAERQFELLEFVTSADKPWDELLDDALLAGLLSADVVARAAGCCQDGWTNVTVGGNSYEASILTTSFVTQDVTIASCATTSSRGTGPAARRRRSGAAWTCSPRRERVLRTTSRSSACGANRHRPAIGA